METEWSAVVTTGLLFQRLRARTAVGSQGMRMGKGQGESQRRCWESVLCLVVEQGQKRKGWYNTTPVVWAHFSSGLGSVFPEMD